MSAGAAGLPRKWKMRDGQKVLISEMSDEHLSNSITMCTRVWSEISFRAAARAAYAAESYAADAPDGAALAAEESAKWYFTKQGREYLLAERIPMFRALVSERDRRAEL